jgi:hypothetical protein
MHGGYKITPSINEMHPLEVKVERARETHHPLVGVNEECFNHSSKLKWEPKCMSLYSKHITVQSHHDCHLFLSKSIFTYFYNAYHIPLKYKCLIKRSDHIRPTNLSGIYNT